MTIQGFPTSFSGEYSLTVKRPDGTQVQTPWFKNVITNIGLDRLGVGSPINFARVGTGTSTPSILNTVLDAQIAGSASGSTSSSVNLGAPSYNAQHTFSFTFNQGAVVGNITEIGVGWDAANTATLFSRALILDTGGNPISVSVTAIDQLTVFYRLTIIPQLTDVTGVVNISGTPYNYTGRIAQVGSFFNSAFFTSGGSIVTMNTNAGVFNLYGTGATLGGITGNPSAASSTGINVSASYGSYTTGNYYRDATANLSTALGNTSGGIAALRVPLASTGMYYQYLFNPIIPKDNTKTFSMTFRVSWARA